VNTGKNDIAFVGIGITAENDFAKRMKADYNATAFYFDYKQKKEDIAALVAQIKSKYKKVIIGLHAYNRAPANNFGISSAAVELARQLQQQTSSISVVFGNPYTIKNFCTAKNIIACYEDDAVIQQAAADLLLGKFSAKGTLPVTICEQYKFGSGITGFFLPKTITPSTQLTR
jgi:beta-N-acetylhexosaminidase